MTEDEKWIFYDKKKKYYAKPGQSLPSTSTSTPRPNIHASKIILCIWWDQKSLVYYAETWRFYYGRSVSATIDSFEPCIARKTSKNMIKLFLFRTLGLMYIAKKNI